MNDRYDTLLAERRRKITRQTGEQVYLVVIDEYAYLGYDNDSIKNEPFDNNWQVITPKQEECLFHRRRREHETDERAANSVFIGSDSLLMRHDQQGSLPVFTVRDIHHPILDQQKRRVA